MDRHHNIFWPQLADDRLTGAFIADGHHLPPDTLKAMLRAKGNENTILVTDAVAAAGAPVGVYSLASLKVQVDSNRKVTQVGASNLAGSALTLDVAIGHVCEWCHLSLEEAWALASVRAASAVGIEVAGTVEVDWTPATFKLVVRSTRL